jgi:hypothetical protein
MGLRPGGVEDDRQIDKVLGETHIKPVFGLDPRMMSATQIWSRPVGLRVCPGSCVAAA